jgi:hypothetical protein
MSTYSIDPDNNITALGSHRFARDLINLAIEANRVIVGNLPRVDLRQTRIEIVLWSALRSSSATRASMSSSSIAFSVFAAFAGVIGVPRPGLSSNH